MKLQVTGLPQLQSKLSTAKVHIVLARSPPFSQKACSPCFDEVLYIYMKPISVYVEELDYEELKALAASRRQPVAELIREAMTEYLVRSRAKSSMRDLPPLTAGRQREDWEREELYDEMLEERA